LNGVDFSEINSDVRAQLLLTSLPRSDGEIRKLRRSAKQATTNDATKCTWYRDLGSPRTTNLVTLSLMRFLAPTAIAHYQNQKPHIEASRIRNMYGSIAGAAVGIFAGLIATVGIVFICSIIYWIIKIFTEIGEQTLNIFALFVLIVCVGGVSVPNTHAALGR